MIKTSYLVLTVYKKAKVHSQMFLNRDSDQTAKRFQYLKNSGQSTPPYVWSEATIDLFHNSSLIRWIKQNKIYKHFRDLTNDWTKIAWLAFSHSNHYIRMFSGLMWGYNWILFMHGWFSPIRLIHPIRWKSLHFEKSRM